MEHIINLIRHGKTDANTLNLIAGVTDRPLNETGINEINKFIEEKIYSRSVKYCFSSKLSRSINTMKMIYPGIRYEIDERFNEINFGDYEDSCFDNFKDNKEYMDWITQDNKMLITAPNGEPIVDARKRFFSGLKYTLTKMDELKIDEYAIFSHGNILAEFTYLALNDNRNVKTRIDTTFPNALGIRINACIDDEDKIVVNFLNNIGEDFR